MEIKKQLAPSKEDLANLHQNFWNFTASQFPNLPPESEDLLFLFSAFEGETFKGGITGSVYWNGLEIDTLWVDDDCRGTGLGSRLLAEAEDFGRNNGAVISFLKTFDAQGFYEKQGYQIFGVLEDRPIGTQLYHLKKRLS